ncbi:hypothetical protein L1049_026595 [Liquidambar formosana]|uniref:Neurobeachin beta-propeller domain-containing protein n=1 Tax=Liquidambar formosana TaxID=63359 RepID=A0AAP0ND10_LIQFO
MNSLEVVRKYNGVGKIITSLTVTPEECFLAGTKDGTLLVYSIENPQLRKANLPRNVKSKASSDSSFGEYVIIITDQRRQPKESLLKMQNVVPCPSCLKAFRPTEFLSIPASVLPCFMFEDNGNLQNFINITSTRRKLIQTYTSVASCTHIE